MSDIAYIDLKQCILEDNDNIANDVRTLCKEKKFFLWNIMSSPGSGKTTFIIDVIKRLGKSQDNESGLRFAVIEGDVESTCDSEKMHALGIPTVQLRTGGGCHLDAAMVMKALEQLPLEDLDVVIVENIGNLVCPAEFDLGASLATMILSIPEGDDKCIKYPLMFTVTKAVIISKMDVKEFFDFSFENLEKNTRRLNADLQFFPVSAKTGEGMDTFCQWLTKQYNK